ncbi:hypothetical protein BDN72DRAFT_840703, partial [Pluteus cervinus]
MRIVEFDQPTPSASTSSSAPSTALSTPVGKEQQLFPDISDNFEGYEKPLADMVGTITFEFEPATQDNHKYAWKKPIVKEKTATSSGTAQDGFDTSAYYAGPSLYATMAPAAPGFDSGHFVPSFLFDTTTTSLDDSWFSYASSGPADILALSTAPQPQFSYDEAFPSNWDTTHRDPTILFDNDKPLAPMGSQVFASPSMPSTDAPLTPTTPVKQGFPIVADRSSAVHAMPIRDYPNYAQAPARVDPSFSPAFQRHISTTHYQQQRRFQRMQMHNPYPQHQAMQPQWEYVNPPMATQSPQFQTYPALSSQVPQPSYQHYPGYGQGGSSSTYIPSQSDLDLFKNW